MKMYKLGRYKQTDRMSDLICENYPMLLVLSRFGISLGFGDKTIGEVCEDSGVDTKTFLTIVNLLLDDHTTAEQIDPSLSVEALGELTGLNPGELATLLVGLELAGAVRQLPGNRYMKLI